MLLLAVLMGSFLFTANAMNDKKDKKNKKVAEKVVPAPLATSSDSLSYAAGMAHTNGLVAFLLQNKMDTAYMADFVAGFKEAMAAAENPSKAAYIQGLEVAKMLNDRMLPGLQKSLEGTTATIDQERFIQGFIAGVQNDTAVYTVNNAEKLTSQRIQQLNEEKKERLYGKNREEGKKFLTENATKEGVVTLPSGLQYKVLVKGEGAVPKDNDEVSVKYEGKLLNGTVFDSSYKRTPQTTNLRPSQVIKGWKEALSIMPVGSTWELYIPQELAYGEREAGQIPPYSTLIFKVELVDIVGQKAEAKAEEPAKATTVAKKTPVRKTAVRRRK